MAEEEHQEATTAPSEARAGRAFWWLRIVSSLFALCVAGGISTAFCIDYLRSRPVDLNDECVRVADEFESLLVENCIAADRLSRDLPEAFHNQAADWCLHRFEITLPPDLTVEAIEALVRRKISRFGIGFTSLGPTSEGHTTISLSYGEHCCVTARIRETRAGSHAAPVDEAPSERTVVAEEEAGGEVEATTEATAPAALPEVQLPVLPRARTTHVDEVFAGALPELHELDLESDTIDESGLEEVEAGVPSEAALKRVAIVVDDGGYGGPVSERILALDPNLTLAVLPHTPHAEDTARRAAELGFEVLLHMPMEAADFPGCLTTAMTEAEIRELTLAALADVPDAVGINNHRGSVFTADRKAMIRFLNILRGGSLFFIDSRTTVDTVAYETARSLGVPTAQRRVFLDHDDKAASIRAQFDRLVRMALQEGEAIAICHFRPRTADMLPKLLGELEERAIALVHVSELVQ